MEWSFHYAGPRAPSTDYECATCLAQKTKKCPTHGTAFVTACAHCQAAQGGPCRANWGLEAALAAHPAPTDELGAKDWAAAVAFTLEEMAAIPADKTRVLVKLRGDALEDGRGGVHREFHLELSAR